MLQQQKMRFRASAVVLIVVTTAMLTCMAPVPAIAAEFYAIIANLTNVKLPYAQIDASVDTLTAQGPVDLNFTVSGVNGSQIAEFALTTNDNGFVTTAGAIPPTNNLFALSAGAPVLVHVTTPHGADTYSLVLRQTMRQTRTIFAVEPARLQNGTPFAQGKLFSVALGDIKRRATLLIANVSGSDVAVDVFLGTKAAFGTGKYSNPDLQNQEIWIVDLDRTDAHSNLVVSSTDNVVAQLAVDEGKKNAITFVDMLPR